MHSQMVLHVDPFAYTGWLIFFTGVIGYAFIFDTVDPTASVARLMYGEDYTGGGLGDMIANSMTGTVAVFNPYGLIKRDYKKMFAWWVRVFILLFLLVLWILGTVVFSQMYGSDASITLPAGCTAFNGEDPIPASYNQGLAIFAYAKYTLFFWTFVLAVFTTGFFEAATGYDYTDLGGGRREVGYNEIDTVKSFESERNQSKIVTDRKWIATWCRVFAMMFCVSYVISVILNFVWMDGAWGMRSYLSIGGNGWAVVAIVAFSFLFTAMAVIVFMLIAPEDMVDNDDTNRYADKWIGSTYLYAQRALKVDRSDASLFEGTGGPILHLNMNLYITVAYVAMDMYTILLYFADPSRATTYALVVHGMPLVLCLLQNTKTAYWYYHVITQAVFWSAFWIFYSLMPGASNTAFDNSGANFFWVNTRWQWLFYPSQWCQPATFAPNDVLASLYAFPVLAIVCVAMTVWDVSQNSIDAMPFALYGTKKHKIPENFERLTRPLTVRRRTVRPTT